MIRKFGDLRQASRAAVEYIIEKAGTAVKDKGYFSLVLSGGTTPKTLYRMLSKPDTAEQIPWQQSHVFWGDERWVAATDPDSNFRLANNELLANVPIPPQNIHRIATDQSSPEAGAEKYETELHDFFLAKSRTAVRKPPKNLFPPSFDLVLLGMGPDGHTASLFPGTPILEEKGKWVAAVPAGTGNPPVARITLTLQVLNQAENVLFLIAGEKKKEVLDTIVTTPEDAVKLYPAARIRPTGDLIWLVAEKP